MLAPALTLGALFDAEYTLVQVVEAIGSANAQGSPVPPPREQAAIAQHHRDAEHYLETLAVPLRADGYRITTQLVVDPHPALAILRAAGEQRSDVIALATHGRGGVRRLLLGSVADKVLRGADRPVLLYRPPAAQSSENER